MNEHTRSLFVWTYFSSLIPIAFLFALTTLALQTVSPAYAQEDQNNAITPTENDVTINFPGTITFTLNADFDAPVSTVNLRYGTEGQSCNVNGALTQLEQEDEAAWGQSIDTSWGWEIIRSGILPPGAPIWWQWEVRLEDGRLLTTPRQTTPLVDDRYNWRTVNRNGVSVNWFVGDNQFGQSILTESINSLERVSDEMGIPIPEDVELWIYPTSSDVRDALVRVPEWTGGVAFPEYTNTVIGISPGEDEWAAEVIPHELTHLLVGHRIFNCRGTRLPTWLNEGLAMYAEPGNGITNSDRMERALQRADLPPLRSLANGFSSYSDSANISYTYSGNVVFYLIDQYGGQQMDQVLERVKDGALIDQALQEVYELNTDQLDAEFRNSLGFAATPTLESDVIALAATPTIIPTIALGLPLVPATETPIPTPSQLPTATQQPENTPTPAATGTLPATAEPDQIAAADTGQQTELQTDLQSDLQSDGSASQQAQPEMSQFSIPWWAWLIAAAIGIILIIVLIFSMLTKRGA